jgi:hypothetical protein
MDLKIIISYFKANLQVKLYCYILIIIFIKFLIEDYQMKFIKDMTHLMYKQYFIYQFMNS